MPFSLIWLFSLFSRKFLCCARSSVFLSIASCCSSFSAQIRRSSTTTSTPSMSPNMSDMMAWKTSWADEISNGSLLNMYLPKGVLKVQSLALLLSNLICQYPEVSPRTEKILTFGILVSTSSMVGMG